MPQLDAHLQFSNALTETAPLIRAALERLDGRNVLITTADDAPITNGRLVVVEGQDGPLMPSLMMEFMLRGIVFTMEIPLGCVFTLVASWNGQRFIFRMPRDQRLTVELPAQMSDASAAGLTLSNGNGTGR